MAKEPEPKPYDPKRDGERRKGSEEDRKRFAMLLRVHERAHERQEIERKGKQSSTKSLLDWD